MVDHLSFLSDLLHQHLPPEMSLNQLRSLNIGNLEDQAEQSIPFSDDCILGKHNCYCPPAGSGDLDKEETNNSGIKEDTNDSLDTLEDDGIRTLMAGNPQTIPNGCLCLYTEGRKEDVKSYIPKTQGTWPESA